MLVAAAINNRLDIKAITNVKRAHAFRTVRLVSRYGKQIDVLPDYVDGNFSDSLRGICMKDNRALAANFSDFCDWLQHSHLLVCGHETDQNGRVGQSLPKAISF